MIKKLLLTLFALCILVPQTSAVKVDIQVERTPQVPGFVSLTIFPPKDPTSDDELRLEEVYIKNYLPEEDTRYKELLQLIREFGGKIISVSQAPNWYQKPYTRTVALGDLNAVRADFTFVPQSDETITESFVNFARETLRPVYLQSITIVPEDDNFTETFPQRISFLDEGPVKFIGKFDQEKSMNVILQAYGPREPLQARIKVDIPNITLINSDLPQEWKEIRKGLEDKKSGGFWFNIFPLILALLGIGCLIVAARLKKKEVETDKVPLFIRDIHDTIERETLPFDMEKHEKQQVHKIREN